MTDELLGAMGQIARHSSLVDGTIRISVDLPKESAALWMMEVGAGVILAPRNPNQIQPESDDESVASTAREVFDARGKAYSELHAKGFFRSVSLWVALGGENADRDYLDWLKTRPCWYVEGRCNGDIVAAHVRITEGDLGDAGTGIKPGFSAVPLCDAHHRLQHDHGYNFLAPHADWLKARVKYAVEWAEFEVKQRFNVVSLKEVSLDSFLAWCDIHELMDILPRGWGT